MTTGEQCRNWEWRAAELLVESGVVLRGRFKLSSGKVSDIYIDARRLLGMPRYFHAIVSLLKDTFLSNVDVDAIIGVATGGIAWAAALGFIKEMPIGYVRPKAKEHGLGRVVEGVEPPARALLIDDVATTGGSLASAVEALRHEGFTVDSAVVIVDREEGARNRLEEIGVELRSLTRLSCIRSFLSSQSP